MSVNIDRYYPPPTRLKYGPNESVVIDNCVHVELTQDVTGVVDLDLWVNHMVNYRWYAYLNGGDKRNPSKLCRWVMVGNCKRGYGKVLAHRMVMFLIGSDPPVVDHIHHYPVDKRLIDNTISNLRPANATQNGANRRVVLDPQERLKGVDRLPSGKWRATISVDNRKQHIGTFDSATDAARAYDDYAVQLYGEFAVLNFPGEREVPF